jgi:ribosomal protein S3
VLTLSSNLSYAETVSFTPNGTFGVKVWTYAGTVEKNIYVLQPKKLNTRKLKKGKLVRNLNQTF